VAWGTANSAVLAEGKRMLIDDTTRFDGVRVVGVDEHAWRHTRKGDKFVTVIIDLTPIRDGTGPAAARTTAFPTSEDRCTPISGVAAPTGYEVDGEYGGAGSLVGFAPGSARLLWGDGFKDGVGALAAGCH
jgi:hypothetical protein